MEYATTFAKALHGLWIALCALTGAALGFATPYLIAGWALWQILEAAS